MLELKRELEALETVHGRIPALGMISWGAVVNDLGEVLIIEIRRTQSKYLVALDGARCWRILRKHGRCFGLGKK